MDNHIHPDSNLKHYPIIEGKLKALFGIQPIIISKIKYELYTKYNTSNYKFPITTLVLHKMITKYFIENYYPLISKNLKSNDHITAIIMGGLGFNMNVPNKMAQVLSVPTDDIDIKIYTTEINNIEHSHVKKMHILSVFKYLIIIICMYMKQIVGEIIDFSKHAFQPIDFVKKITKKQNTLHTQTHTVTDTHSTSKISKQKIHSKQKTHSKQKIHSKHSNISLKTVKGGSIKTKQKENYNLIKTKQRKYGVLKKCKIKLIIKHKHAINNDGSNDIGDADEHIDITDMSFDDTYKIIMTKINDPNLLVTTKIIYTVKYISNFTVPYSVSRHDLTFSDTKVIFPCVEHPFFYAYYFMNNPKQMNHTLKDLIKQHIPISNIIGTKHCNNKCYYISVKSLQVDIVYMLRYAELLSTEDIESGNIVVPIDSLFKYYKYLSKYIRVHAIRKFYNGTLSGFMEPAKKLWRFVEQNLHMQTDLNPEITQLNILYKTIINDFHQAFFIKKTMFPEYEALRDIVTDYNNTVVFINQSCALFKNNLYDSQHVKTNDDAIDTIDTISIKYAEHMISKNKVLEDNSVIDRMEGGKKIVSKNIIKVNKRNQSKIVLHNDYTFDDIELDGKFPENLQEKYKTKKHIRPRIMSERIIIIDKLHELIKNEIHFLNKLSKVKK